ncbi:ATP-dependent DNA helicase II subunit 2 [Serendipita sp. 399]|nr:ATP-dependent DNA helicase II subunit 2 [Serendipita sp. 399]
MSMGKMREVELPPEDGKPPRTVQMTNLDWAMQFVKLKMQELPSNRGKIFHNRKTDLCGIILAGSDDTNNQINDTRPDEYHNVVEFMKIAHPTPTTLAQLSRLKPSKETNGDPLDGLIVAIDAQNKFLASKPSWSRKLVLVTDGENPIETAEYKQTLEAMNNNKVVTSIVSVAHALPRTVDLTILCSGVDFDDEKFGYQEENKSDIKRLVEKFWRDKFVARLDDGLFATCAYALQECATPEVKETRSSLLYQVLRFGEPTDDPDHSVELNVRVSKATAIARPPPMKKFARSTPQENTMEWTGAIGEPLAAQFAPVKSRTDHFIKDFGENKDAQEQTKAIEGDPDVKIEIDEDGVPILPSDLALVTIPDNAAPIGDENTQLAYKYGAEYIPVDKADFSQLQTRKGLDIVGFIPGDKFRREWAMGEVYYIWPSGDSGRDQIEFSSIVQAMEEEDLCVIIRMVTSTNYAPKLGAAIPRVLDKLDCLLWVQMPFAEDHRNYSFQSLDMLYNKRGVQLAKHPNIPTDEMVEAMDAYVDSMDLMEIEKDDDGNRFPWFDNLYSYNPALHRVKQALFHAAVSSSLATDPLPPPHPELTKYFEQPKRIVKRSKEPIDHCKKVFKIKHAPEKVTARKEAILVDDREDEPLLIGPAPVLPKRVLPDFSIPSPTKSERKAGRSDGGTTEDEDDDFVHVASADAAPSTSVKIKGSPSKYDVDLSTLSSPSKFGVDEEDIKPKIVIGKTTPLEDFKTALADGDIVSEAVSQMADVIKELVNSSQFPNRRKAELLDAMAALREACLKEDEVVPWNEFLRELKKTCLQPAPNGNKPFWDSVKKKGKALTLIGKAEATTAGASAKYAVKNDVAAQVTIFEVLCQIAKLIPTSSSMNSLCQATRRT